MPNRQITLARTLPYILIIMGAVGFICSFVIMHDKLQLLQDPNYRPTCSINPVISCGSIMKSEQSHVFGFPNPIIGLAAFPAVVTIGMAMLSGAKFRRWFWRGLEAGTIFGVGFVTWLFFQSVYRIQALCIYCVIVWVATIAIFWYTTLHNLREGHIPTHKKLRRLAGFAQKHHGDVLLIWYLAIAALILNHFWYYWQTIL